MRFSIFLFLVIATLSSIAQTEPDKSDLKREIVINNEKFRVYNNWVNLGAGVAKITNLDGQWFTGGIGYNFHIKAHYFQFGMDVEGEHFGSYVNTGFHLCYGDRKETKKFNLSYFAGISYTQGYKQVDSTFKFFRAPGLYVCAQFIKNLKYDLGLGPGVFADINQTRAVFGIRLDLYFSSAYRGKKK